MLGIYRGEFPQKLSVAKGRTVGTIRFDEILVELTHLDDNASSVPFQRKVASLVLEADMVTDP